MTRFFLLLLKIYQNILSPDHSDWGKRRYPYGYCRFYPSCSEYTRQAVIRYGSLRGVIKALWRILRCNPFSLGGFDPAVKGEVKGGKG